MTQILIYCICYFQYAASNSLTHTHTHSHSHSHHTHTHIVAYFTILSRQSPGETEKRLTAYSYHSWCPGSRFEHDTYKYKVKFEVLPSKQTWIYLYVPALDCQQMYEIEISGVGSPAVISGSLSRRHGTSSGCRQSPKVHFRIHNSLSWVIWEDNRLYYLTWALLNLLPPCRWR